MTTDCARRRRPRVVARWGELAASVRLQRWLLARAGRCLEHDECIADPEMGRLCAADQEMRRHAVTCPRCDALSPCDDWVEIDLGVGVQRFDRGWTCPRCGAFGLNHANEIVFECDDDDDAASSWA